MTKENLDIALELAFEMEGLISLMQKREDMTPPQVEALLKRKALEFATIVAPDKDILCGNSHSNDVIASPLPAESDDNINDEISQSVLTEEVEDADIQQPVSSVHEEEKTPITSSPETPSTSSKNENRQIVFTINDRFRFRRELFDDDQEEFDSTMLLISGMENMGEIEDYLYNDLCLDSSDEVVCEFVGALRANFDGR